MLSNFYPAQFSLDGQYFAHVEQNFQYTKAIHHDENEMAKRIMDLSDPLRIKSLGDGIEGNQGWKERRMLVLYDGVRGKFEQNLSLQDELLSTQGMHLYEVTTDTYYGCGIGYDSNRWQKKDWIGENVAGLVLKRVRDELLGIEYDETSVNNTLNEIASQEDVCASSSLENNHDTAGKDTDMLVDKSDSPAKSVGNSTQTACDSNLSEPLSTLQTDSYPSKSSQRNRGRGRGRGRGQGSNKGYRGNSSPKSQLANYRRNSMSSAERNFLGIKDKNIHKTMKSTQSKGQVNSSSPKLALNQLSWNNLTQDQKKGLINLGLVSNPTNTN